MRLSLTIPPSPPSLFLPNPMSRRLLQSPSHVQLMKHVLSLPGDTSEPFSQRLAAVRNHGDPWHAHTPLCLLGGRGVELASWVTVGALFCSAVTVQLSPHPGSETEVSSGRLVLACDQPSDPFRVFVQSCLQFNCHAAFSSWLWSVIQIYTV